MTGKSTSSSRNDDIHQSSICISGNEKGINKADFLKLEYATLRKEIEETKARIFKLAGIGIIGMPSAYYFARAKEIEILILSLPLLICTVVMLFLA